MKEVSTISKRKSKSRPQNRRQQPRPVNKGYGDAGASWHKKATKGFRAMSGSPKEDIDANNYTLRQRARMLYMAAPIATSAIRTNRTNVGGPSASFGIWHEYLDDVFALQQEFRLRITRMHTHIGSGADPDMWNHCARMSLAIAARFPEVQTLNLGGGFKVARMPDAAFTPLHGPLNQGYSRSVYWLRASAST